MSKKKFGKFVALATISGVIAAGISYFLKYKSFHEDLNEDFHNFEGDDDEFDGKLPHASESSNRTYVTINEKKDESAELIKDGLDRGADAVNNLTKAAADAAEEFSGKAKEIVNSATNKADVISDMIKDTVKATVKAAKKTVDTTATIEDDFL